jgi:hypothetical protein
MSINTLIMDQHGTRKETNQEVHGGIPTLQDDIKDRETIPWHQRHDKDQDQGGKANSWTSCSSSIRMDGFMYLVPVGYIA